MSGFEKLSPRSTERRALLAGSALAALTTIHHVYGAIRYDTPWRLHAAAIAALAAIAMLAALRISRARPTSPAGWAARWAFWGINAVVFVLFFGLFEGLYNHVLKDILYLAGTPMTRMRALFPPPMYEMPNDGFFELTGVLQVVPAAVSAYYLGRLLLQRPRGARQRTDLRPEATSR